MNFTPKDLERLYGERIFILPDVLKGEAGYEESVQAAEEETPQETVEATSTETPAQESMKQEAEPPVIEWKPKDNSKVLFVLRPKEFTDRSLTNLLKKIVEAMKIPFSDAGFGIMREIPSETDWEAMPNQFAIIFDEAANFSRQNPLIYKDKEIHFAPKLAQLNGNREAKKELWDRLQGIMEKI